VNLWGPGGTSANGGFGERTDSDLRSHYVGILGAHTEFLTAVQPSAPALVYFCGSSPGARGSVYAMELQQSTGGIGSGAACLDPGSAGKVATNGIIVRKEPVSTKSVTDGTSNTFMIGEAAFGLPDTDTNFRPWIVGSVGDWIYNVRNIAYPINYAARNGPYNPDRSDVSCGSEHSSGTHFAFADNSVRFLSDATDLVTLYYLASRAGDEVISGEAGN
jgi:hypothetical protein